MKYPGYQIVRNIKNTVKQFTPTLLLRLYSDLRAVIKRKIIFFYKVFGKSYSKEKLIEDLQKIGVKPGDILLVHCKMSSIGHIKNGKEDLINALLEAIDCPNTGTLLMPSFPINSSAEKYFENNPIFDVRKTQSKMGVVSETFRNMNGVLRSIHPSHPVTSLGPMTEYLLKDHFKEKTPFNENSPFYKICKKNGKILLIGLRMSQSLTSLHIIEDVIKDFKYPVYSESINTTVIDYHGVTHNVEVRFHNIHYSNMRKCDEIAYIFDETTMKKGKVGKAECLLFDSNKMLNTMIDYYYKGVTIYSPYAKCKSM